MTWWKNASTSQRLAQIDAGIELGLTARQIALASGVTASVIHHTAGSNGRSLISSKPVAARKRSAIVRRDRDQFLRGNAVDFWSHEEPRHRNEIDEVAF